MNLYDIRAQRARVSLLRERIEALQSDIERITQVPRNMPGGAGAGHDALSGKVAKLVDLKAQLADKVAEVEAKTLEIDTLFSGLPEQQRTVLWFRYVEGLSWSAVSKRVGYSRRHCLRIHSAAIKKMAHNVTTKRGIMVP